MSHHIAKPPKRDYTHLTLEEREEIAIGLLLHQESLSSIAARLGRHRSSISRESRRNQTEKNTVQYRANRAHSRAMDRQKRAHPS